MIELLKLNRKEAIRGKHSELEPKADDGIKTHSIEGLGKECSRASDCSRTVLQYNKHGIKRSQNETF